MVDALATTIIVAALLVAGFAGLTALLGRPPGRWHLVGLIAVEAALLGQAVVAMGQMFTGERPDNMAVFVGYLLAAVLVPPLATLLGWAEHTRWGSVIIAVACVVVPVMVIRLQQVWVG